MKYLHPDVLDNGPAYLQANALRALVLAAAPDSYAQAVAGALVSVPVAATDFVLGDATGGRLLRFMGARGKAQRGCDAGQDLHIAFTDGVGRLLWITSEPSRREIRVGQKYRLPAASYLSLQP